MSKKSGTSLHRSRELPLLCGRYGLAQPSRISSCRKKVKVPQEYPSGTREGRLGT